MKINLLSKSLMTIAVAVMAAGCSKEEVLTGSDNIVSGGELKVMVNDLGFINENHDSRVSEEGYTTKFTDGDAIGIYVVGENSVILKNLKASKTEDGWTVDGLFHYEGADYIAYFPYDENLTSEEIMSDADIVTYFDNKFTEDQSLKAGYYACDLMVAKVDAEDVEEYVTFNFSHKRSMLEFEVPVYTFKVSNDENAFAYSAPVGLTVTIGGEVYNPRYMGGGIYRCIVNPTAEDATIDFSGKFTDVKLNKSVTFEKSNITLAANKCISYDINYDGAPDEEPVVRSISVGDYYYSDGSICPGDFGNIPTEGCIGVVFSTSTNKELALDGKTECSHGYVLSLYNATGNKGDNLGTWDYYMWDNTSENNDKIHTVGLTDVAYTGGNGAVDELLIDDLNGQKYTGIIMNNMKSSGEDKLYHAISTYGAQGFSTAKFAAPLSSTGWFVPSVGQCMKLVRELGGFTAFDGSKKTNQDVFTNIEGALTKVGGVLDSNTSNGKFWTSNTSSDKKVYLLELKKAESKCQIWTAGVSSKNRIRPILAF